MQATLNENELKRILQGISIPPQPQILVDLQMEQAMPDPDMEHIATSVSQDVGISAAVLKFVNSSHLDQSYKITSIQQAVMQIGPDSLNNILNGVAVKSELSDDTITSLHSFWDTAAETAAISAKIADQLNFKFKDECYALGLFHNAGVPVMLKRFDGYQDILQQGYQDPKFQLTDMENKAFQTNHSVVGYYLAKSWGLPKSICTVIAEHHRVEHLFNHRVPGDNTYLTFTSILKMSEHIASTHRHIGHVSTDYEWQNIGHIVLEHLDLTEYDFEDIVGACRDEGIGVM